MQKPNLILDILNSRSRKNLEISKIYHYRSNQQWYLLAYDKLANNKGYLTPGETGETIDGMSLRRIEQIINEMRFERYKWHKLRQIDIKPNGRFRTLSILEWRDKLVQEVIRMILSAIYEPKFSEASHGFRPNRGCHSALTRIYQKGQNCEFFIEGDIVKCFDSIDHNILLNILKRDIKDNRFIELIRKMLKAGKFGNDFVYGKTYSGTPQGGVLSPLLVNVYLNEFDQWVENTLVPKWNIMNERPISKEYHTLVNHIYRICRTNKINNVNNNEELKHDLKAMRKKLRLLPTKKNIEDCDFRRLAFTRYADDWIITFTGTFEEAKNIKKEISEYLLTHLSLKLNEEKTKITKADKTPARFLGYNMLVQKSNTRIKHGQRSISGQIEFFVPDDVINNKVKKYMRNNKPIHLAYRLNEPDVDIIQVYQAELRGITQYYKFARNQQKLSKLKYVMEVSLVKTLANKFRTSCRKIYAKYKSTYNVDGFDYKVLEAKVQKGTREYRAHFGGIPLRRKSVINNEIIIDTIFKTNNLKSRSTLSQRLLNDICEVCGSNEKIEMHHIRALKDIKNNKADWAVKMSAMNRKSIALCKQCHEKITHGKYSGRKLK